MFGDQGIPDHDTEGSITVTELFESSLKLREWPQPLFQLIDRTEIPCKVGSCHELVVVVRMEFIRQPRLANALTQSLRSEFRH